MKKARTIIVLITVTFLAAIPFTQQETIANPASMLPVNQSGCYCPADCPTFLRWPLAESYNASKITLGFGATWTWGSCGGYYKKHNAIDYQAKTSDSVYAAQDGIVKHKGFDPSWGYSIVLGHGGGDKYNCYTTTYWHINPTVIEGQTVSRGQLIGYIYDLGSNTHFHFGVRLANYDFPANPGALPRTVCGGYPGFPEYFTNPAQLNYY